jgi:hypothetical protein
VSAVLLDRRPPSSVWEAAVMGKELTIIVAAALGVPLLILLGLVVATLLSRREGAARALVMKAPVDIADLADGEVAKVVGVSRPHDGFTLRSPASGSEVLCYEVHLRWQSGSRMRRVHPTSAAIDFEVADGTGVAHVRAADGVRLVLDPDDEVEIRVDQAPDHILELARRMGLQYDEHGFFFLGERLLEPGEAAAVLGRAASGRTGGVTFELIGDEEVELVVSDEERTHE